MIYLTEQEQKIAAILIERAQTEGKPETASFTELMNAVATGRAKIGEMLSHIGQACKKLDLPVVTVLVVYKNTEITGKGYIDEFHPNEKGKGRDEEIWAEDKKAVANCKDWSKLLNDIVNEQDFDELDCYSASEGKKTTHTVAQSERSTALRNECLRLKWHKCSVCGFDAATVYGKDFEGKIEVHHERPLNQGERKSTVANLYPVCPNCHMILHSKEKNNAYTIKEVEAFYKNKK